MHNVQEVELEIGTMTGLACSGEVMSYVTVRCKGLAARSAALLRANFPTSRATAFGTLQSDMCD